MKWNFDNTYARLPEVLFTKVTPMPVSRPELVLFNEELAADLGMGSFESERDLPVLAGNVAPSGAEPIAQAYSGHQFGHFARLGDGRAWLLGEHVTKDGRRFDIQFKGSGPTPYSRGGDGRAALGPMLREYLISEWMAAVGIPTTRSLAVVATGEPVFRNSVLPGAILTRVASSHIRVGTFQFAASLGKPEVVRALAEATILRHYPEISASSEPVLEFLKAVCRKQAGLIARWLQVGFIHGVMNTDNMAISGETIDYGPCAFLDTYDPAKVYSSIDRGGRYAYGNQPGIAHWNLSRLAEALLPLIDPNHDSAVEKAQAALESFASTFDELWIQGMQAKIGLRGQNPRNNDLVLKLLQLMQEEHADFTGTFLELSNPALPKAGIFASKGFLQWRSEWLKELEIQGSSLDAAAIEMKKLNPRIIPRNHKVKEVLSAAEEGDLSKVKLLLSALRQPHSDALELEEFALPPAPGQEVLETFCGT